MEKNKVYHYNELSENIKSKVINDYINLHIKYFSSFDNVIYGVLNQLYMKNGDVFNE